MVHRGPDDFGLYLNFDTSHSAPSPMPWHVGLGHQRLSIIDLSEAGHQPMSNEDGSVWITYNGEIYNFKELRQDLEKRGHRFKSNTDTEVIIHGYEEWGLNCLDKLNGMFAFGIWDNRNQILVLARDRFGIKPLYYCIYDKGIAFASEIKSLLQFPQIPKQVNLDGIPRYLTFLWVPDPETLFKDIFKLPPGHYAVFKDGKLIIQQYYDLMFEEIGPDDEKYYIGRLVEILRRSVKRHLISDVPLGIFLSGGIDSSSLLALTANQSNRVTTYTVGFGSEALKYEIVPDDVKYARRVAGLFPTDYNEIILNPDVVSLLPKLIWHLDEPVADPAVIASYLICKSAKEKLTVLLSGMGGDEVFAGYPRHLGSRIASIYNTIPGTIRNHIINPIVTLFPGQKGGILRGFYRNAKKFIRSASLPFEEQYVGFCSYYDQNELQLVLTNDLRFNPGEKHLAYLEKVKYLHNINRMLYLDLKTFLPCLNLTYTDKTSMAASVEVRVPFLDRELVEFSAKIPPKFKLNHFARKYIFKKAMKGILPKEIIHRKKAGFGAPIRSWLWLTELRAMIRDFLSEENIRKRGLFNYPEVKKIIEDGFSGKEDNSLRIWAFLTFELWLRTFIDRDGSGPIQ